MNQTRVEKSTDDVLGMPRTFTEAYPKLSEVLTKCIENGSIMPHKKSIFAGPLNAGDLNLQ